jgi:hypothetical protein
MVSERITRRPQVESGRWLSTLNGSQTSILLPSKRKAVPTQSSTPNLSSKARFEKCCPILNIEDSDPDLDVFKDKRETVIRSLRDLIGVFAHTFYHDQFVSMRATRGGITNGGGTILASWSIAARTIDKKRGSLGIMNLK